MTSSTIKEDTMKYFQKANEYYNDRDYKKAIVLYEKAIKLKDNEVSSLYNSAVCLIKLKGILKGNS